MQSVVSFALRVQGSVHTWQLLCVDQPNYWASPSSRFVQPPVISFEDILQQSTPFSPVVFILSPGSDPVSDLMKLAERTYFKASRLKFLAMGQGQEEVTWMGGWGCAVSVSVNCKPCSRCSGTDQISFP